MEFLLDPTMKRHSVVLPPTGPPGLMATLWNLLKPKATFRCRMRAGRRIRDNIRTQVNRRMESACGSLRETVRHSTGWQAEKRRVSNV